MGYKNMNWITYSVMAAVSFSFMVLIYKKLLLLGINQNILNLFIFGIVFIGFGSIVVYSKTQIKLTSLMILLLVLASVFSLFGNYFQVKAYNEAPNPGYASTIVATQLILIAILSVFLYNSEFTWTKFLGIIIVVFGSYLVSI